MDKKCLGIALVCGFGGAALIILIFEIIVRLNNG